MGFDICVTFYVALHSATTGPMCPVERVVPISLIENQLIDRRLRDSITAFSCKFSCTTCFVFSIVRGLLFSFFDVIAGQVVPARIHRQVCCLTIAIDLSVPQGIVSLERPVLSSFFLQRRNHRDEEI